MVTWDPALAPAACAACGERTPRVDDACPRCATRAALARRAHRPAVAVGPWPRLRVVRGGPLRVRGPGPGDAGVSKTSLAVAAALTLGGPAAGSGAGGPAAAAPASPWSPDVALDDAPPGPLADVAPDDHGGLTVLALGEGVAVLPAGAGGPRPLAPGAVARLARGERLALPGGRELELA